MVSRHLNRFNTGLVIIVLCAVIAIGGLIYFGLESTRQFRATEQSWQSYNDNSNTISSSLNALQRYMGYGGYIHHFKNFILRKDFSYVTRMDEMAAQIYDAIGRLEQSLPTPEERSLLVEVKNTFEEYQQKRVLVLDAVNTMDTEELDALAQVDDTAAINALTRLQRINSARSQTQAEQAQASFEESVDTLFLGSFVILFVVAGAGFLIVMVRRSDRLNINLATAYAQANRLYEESPNALLIVDKTGRVLRVNELAVELFGYPSEELQGMQVEQLMPHLFGQSHEDHRDKVLDTSGGRKLGMRDQELYALTKDGRELRVDIGITRYSTEDGFHTLLAVSDITAAVALENELLDSRKKAEAASEAKSRFLASMSHEIRTPLNGVLGTLQLIDTSFLSDDTQRKIAIAKESGLFLLTLINQVLDFAKIESGVIVTSTERFSLPALLNAMESMFSIRAEMKGLAFKTEIIGETDKFLIGDYDHIRQVLFNLLGNAIKFTDEGQVGLTIRVFPIGDSEVRLVMEVRDSGAGIAPEDQARIFEEFAQTEVGIRHGGGTGLGLNISRRLAEAMGGSLSLTSEVGVGTTFSLTVTAEIAEDQNLVPTDNPSELEIAPLRVLVAEDNDINQIVTRALLEQDGHIVTMAANGLIAVDLVREDPAQFDVILMDIQMPVMDGIQATATIRQILSDTAKLPIIALTANAFSDQKDEYLSIGMQSVLTKPVDQNSLRQELYRLGEQGDAVEGVTGKPDKTSPGISGAYDDHPQLDEKMFGQLSKSFSKERLVDLYSQLEARKSEIVTLLRAPETEKDQASELAHELAGTLGNMGLARARVIAKDIQHAASDGEDFSHLLEKLEEELSALKPVLQARIGT